MSTSGRHPRSARLQLDGYQLSHSLVMLLEGDLHGTPRPCDIRPVDDAAAWDAFHTLNKHDWSEVRRPARQERR